jgi:hypothetical protein
MSIFTDLVREAVEGYLFTKISVSINYEGYNEPLALIKFFSMYSIKHKQDI